MSWSLEAVRRIVLLLTVSLWHLPDHYGDVIMGAITSQITSLTTVYSTVYSDADQRKHQSSASLVFVWGIHRGPVNSLHKWQVTRKMFPFDDVIMHLDSAAAEVPVKFQLEKSKPESFDVFFDMQMNKRLSKQSRRRWFETPSCPLWRHYDVNGLSLTSDIEVHMIHISRVIITYTFESLSSLTQITQSTVYNWVEKKISKTNTKMREPIELTNHWRKSPSIRLYD